MSENSAMASAVAGQLDEIAELCRRFGVRRLELFGSAVSGNFRSEGSDVDLLAEFDSHPDMPRFDAYFGMKESLESLFGRPVDLVDPSALRNPYFAATVGQSRTELYAA